MTKKDRAKEYLTEANIQESLTDDFLSDNSLELDSVKLIDSHEYKDWMDNIDGSESQIDQYNASKSWVIEPDQECLADTIDEVSEAMAFDAFENHDW